MGGRHANNGPLRRWFCVVDSLFIAARIVCEGFVFGSCFGMQNLDQAHKLIGSDSFEHLMVT